MVQAIGGLKLVVAWRVNPAAMPGQERTMFPPAKAAVNVGGGGETSEAWMFQEMVMVQGTIWPKGSIDTDAE